uniref:Uncharacterized protein n=1 Tax=Emericellopsis sp. TaxID=88752 RepID=A0AA96NL19_9HYPO|nr:hypothetical protein [Emericellopsis sp.]
MTTSTVFTTTVHMVTSCPPEVTNCPNGPHVVTEIIPLYKIVCPVMATHTDPSSVETAAAPSAPQDHENITTVLSSTYTITSCPVYVDGCTWSHHDKSDEGAPPAMPSATAASAVPEHPSVPSAPGSASELPSASGPGSNPGTPVESSPAVVVPCETPIVTLPAGTCVPAAAASRWEAPSLLCAMVLDLALFIELA